MKLKKFLSFMFSSYLIIRSVLINTKFFGYSVLYGSGERALLKIFQKKGSALEGKAVLVGSEL